MPSSIKRGRAILPAALCTILFLSFVFHQQPAGSTMPYALLMLVLIIAMLLTGGMEKRREKGFAQSSGPISPAQVPAVRFSDVAAKEEAMSSLRDLVANNLLVAPVS